MTADAAATRLILIRHGEPQAALEGIVAGHAGCSGLSERGRRQAEALRDRLLRTGEFGTVEALYTSEMARAVETAEIIRPALGELSVARDCELCELHVGDADGHAIADWEHHWEAHDLYHSRYPGGESVAELTLRAGARIVRLVREHEGQTVVVVCHGGVVRSALYVLGRWALGTGFWLGPDHTSITELERTLVPVGAARFEWSLLRFADAAHVHGL